jgi:hypothetical protein
MIYLAKIGKGESSNILMVGPHWAMLLVTYSIVVGLSFVIFGIVLNARDTVSPMWRSFRNSNQLTHLISA